MKDSTRPITVGEHLKEQVTGDKGKGGMSVVVGMATCGIAAGATPVYKALSEGIAEEKLEKVSLTQTGCIGICQYEPIVEVFGGGHDRITYVKMNATKARRVVKEHLLDGKVVEEYTIGAGMSGGGRNK